MGGNVGCMLGHPLWQFVLFGAGMIISGLGFTLSAEDIGGWLIFIGVPLTVATLWIIAWDHFVRRPEHISHDTATSARNNPDSTVIQIIRMGRRFVAQTGKHHLDDWEFVEKLEAKSWYYHIRPMLSEKFLADCGSVGRTVFFQRDGTSLPVLAERFANELDRLETNIDQPRR